MGRRWSQHCLLQQCIFLATVYMCLYNIIVITFNVNHVPISTLQCVKTNCVCVYVCVCVCMRVCVCMCEMLLYILAGLRLWCSHHMLFWDFVYCIAVLFCSALTAVFFLCASSSYMLILVSWSLLCSATPWHPTQMPYIAHVDAIGVI